MIRALVGEAFSATRRTPRLWLLALLSGETGLVAVILPWHSIPLPAGVHLPSLTWPLALALGGLLAVLWLFSALAFAVLVVTSARALRHQGTAGGWSAAWPWFWPMLGLRLIYLLGLALLTALLTLFPSSPLAWVGVSLATTVSGLLLNLATRALVLEAQPWSALRSVLAHRTWRLVRAWIGSQIMAMLILTAFLSLVLILEIIAFLVFYATSQAPDPYFVVVEVLLGICVALPLLGFSALAGALVNSYWTAAWLRLRSIQ